MPLSNTKWFKNEKDISNDEYFNIKNKLIDIQNEQCLISTLTIGVSLFRGDFYLKKIFFLILKKVFLR